MHILDLAFIGGDTCRELSNLYCVHAEGGSLLVFCMCFLCNFSQGNRNCLKDTLVFNKLRLPLCKMDNGFFDACELVSAISLPCRNIYVVIVLLPLSWISSLMYLAISALLGQTVIL